jgi:hypothetical protein
LAALGWRHWADNQHPRLEFLRVVNPSPDLWLGGNGDNSDWIQIIQGACELIDDSLGMHIVVPGPGEFRQEGLTALRMISGRAEFSVGEREADERIAWVLVNGDVIEAEDARFSIELKDREDQLSVYEGTVHLIEAEGPERYVHTGEHAQWDSCVTLPRENTSASTRAFIAGVLNGGWAWAAEQLQDVLCGPLSSPDHEPLSCDLGWFRGSQETHRQTLEELQEALCGPLSPPNHERPSCRLGWLVGSQMEHHPALQPALQQVQDVLCRPLSSLDRERLGCGLEWFLGSERDHRQTLEQLQEALHEPLSPPDRERLSYELGRFLSFHMDDPAPACAHWQNHARTFPNGRFTLRMAEERRYLRCPR